MNQRDFPFRDRRHAGRVLAGLLEGYRGEPQLVVLALPRGGVAVAFEVAHALEAPLDVCVVRKLGFPGHEEYAMGAIAGGGVQVLNPEAAGKVSRALIAQAVAREQVELQRRERLYRGEQPRLQLQGRTVIVVDDGLATGSTMRAAVLAIRQQQPARICVAVPVGARETCERLRKDADDVVCAAMPSPFRAVGLAYQDFQQAGDDEVRTLLEAARRERALATH
ncbi:MAG: Erythromycin esterase [Ramlibacter sp.]|nr:Erythromycin esterase [Ramlibacter sp.]